MACKLYIVPHHLHLPLVRVFSEFNDVILPRSLVLLFLLLADPLSDLNDAVLPRSLTLGDWFSLVCLLSDEGVVGAGGVCFAAGLLEELVCFCCLLFNLFCADSWHFFDVFRTILQNWKLTQQKSCRVILTWHNSDMRTEKTTNYNTMPQLIS